MRQRLALPIQTRTNVATDTNFQFCQFFINWKALKFCIEKILKILLKARAQILGRI